MFVGGGTILKLSLRLLLRHRPSNILEILRVVILLGHGGPLSLSHVLPLVEEILPILHEIDLFEEEVGLLLAVALFQEHPGSCCFELVIGSLNFFYVYFLLLKK